MTGGARSLFTSWEVHINSLHCGSGCRLACCARIARQSRRVGRSVDWENQQQSAGKINKKNRPPHSVSVSDRFHASCFRWAADSQTAVRTDIAGWGAVGGGGGGGGVRKIGGEAREVTKNVTEQTGGFSARIHIVKHQTGGLIQGWTTVWLK